MCCFYRYVTCGYRLCTVCGGGGGTVYAPWLPDTGILLTKHSNTLRLKHVNTLNNQNT